MKKILKSLLIICALFSINSYVYASYLSYDAEEYIMKINNINEKIERIDLVSFEECDMEETGWNYTTNFEVVPLFGEDTIKHLDKHDTENYYIKQRVRYNYLAGKAAQDIEHTVLSGKYSEIEDGKLITFDFARNERFKSENEFYDYCNVTYDNEFYGYYKADEEFICVKTTTYYKSYKLTPIKEISLSNIENNTLTYNHDDYSNLKIGIRMKNENGEYKTFISNDNSMLMIRYGGNPIKDKEKITIFDYSTGTYEDNSEYSFKFPIKTGEQWLATMIVVSIILLIIVIALIILNIILKKKKMNKKIN